MYEEWLVKHRKSYNNNNGVDHDKRFEIFKDNLRFIEEHNAKNGTSYKLGLNRFADLTNEEYRGMYLGSYKDDAKRRVMKAKNASPRYAFNKADDYKLPKHVDWRLKGALNAIKNQGSCGMFLFFLSFSFLCHKVLSFL